MIPILIFSLAAIGLNLLTGYTGLLSLGTGAFMGVGAYACYKLTSIFPGVNIVIADRVPAFFAAAVGARVRAASRCASRASISRSRRWPRSSSCTGASFAFPGSTTTTSPASIEVPERERCSAFRSPDRARRRPRYLIVLSIVVVMTLVASNLIHGRIGRTWMAVRDMDIAAELIGIRLYRPSSWPSRCRRSTAASPARCWSFSGYGNAESESFNINQSFLILFMVIIGGLGSLLGSYFGAALIYGLPIVLRMCQE